MAVFCRKKSVHELENEVNSVYNRTKVVRTASIVIIGDELLAGRVYDSNGQFLALQLRRMGLDVRHIIHRPLHHIACLECLA